MFGGTILAMPGSAMVTFTVHFSAGAVGVPGSGARAPHIAIAAAFRCGRWFRLLWSVAWAGICSGVFLDERTRAAIAIAIFGRRDDWRPWLIWIW